MEKGDEFPNEKCLNCDTIVVGAYCHSCGQRIRDNSDRSLRRLLSEVFNNLFFFDNRLFKSIGYLFRFPGRMTIEILAGKRRKFIRPVTLFLFVNVIYFLVNPLSDYSLSLNDQINGQVHSRWIKEWVVQKIQNEGHDLVDYSVSYQNTSDNISKSIMILNVPLIAVLVYLMGFKRRRYYFDSIIFSFHFFSLYMFSWVLLDWMVSLTDFLLQDEESMVSYIIFMLFAFIVPLFYAIIAIKKFYDYRWYWAILGGVGVMLAVQLANLLYRFIIFVFTFWLT